MRLRVLHVTSEFPPVCVGGLGTALEGLAAASTLAGERVAVLLVDQGRPAPRQASEGGSSGQNYYRPSAAAVSGVSKRLVAIPSALSNPPHLERLASSVRGVDLFRVTESRAIGEISRFVRGWRPSIIHLHVPWLWPIARAARSDAGLPVVYTAHSVARAEFDLGGDAAEWLANGRMQEAAIAGADRVVAVSRADADLLASYHPDAARRLRVVRHGAPWPAWKGPDRRRPVDPPIVLFAGRLIERKGVRDLLAAFPQIKSSSPEARLVFAGGEPGRHPVELAETWLPPMNGLAGAVQFTGWLDRSQLRRLYRRATVLAVPSRYEPFGLVVLEAMAAGLPVVAAGGGPSEIIDHGRTGLLVRPRNPAALAAAVGRLLVDPGLRATVADAAAADVRERWSWSAPARALQRVYEEALGTGVT